tara:strand:- start:90 stop:812 length:723 start_codon:yes stop_codon:yes gene_type:complete
MPYNRVIAIGDSFTRGDELADCPEYKPDWSSKFKCEDTSESTWPALIAKSLNCNYECCAVGGRGNQWISWACNAYFTPDTLCIVNWTWFERFDYFDVSVDDWRTTHPRHDEKLDHYFYRNLDSDVWNLHRNLQQIHSTISLLKQNNVNFIMTCLDNSYLNDLKDFRPGKQSNTVWTNAVSNLQEQVVPHIVDFEGMNFLEWSKHNSFELGPNGHPLEKAHAEAAKYINTNVIKGITNEHR